VGAERGGRVSEAGAQALRAFGLHARRAGGEQQEAVPLELFYDVVFVFAVTQVAHLLLDDLSWAGAGDALLALLVVW